MIGARRALTLFMISLFVLTGLFAVLGIIHALAATNAEIAPNPANTSPDRYSHVFFMRKDQDWGNNSNLEIKAYYPKDMTQTQWANATLKIRPGGSNINDMWVCQKDRGSNNDTNYLREFITVTLKTNSETKDYHIPYAEVCTGGQQDHVNREGRNSDNVFFGTYTLPGRFLPAQDRVTERYVVDITIKYHANVPRSTNNTGNTLRFDVRGNTGGLKIGMQGQLTTSPGISYAFPLISDAQFQTDTRALSTDIPFGLSCNITEKRNARVGLYDADNGSIYWPGTTMSFRVKDKETGNYIQFIAGSEDGGSLSDNRRKFTPRDGEVNIASALAEFKPDNKYQMEIEGIIPRNVIDVALPGDTIFGDVSCERWNIKGESKVVATAEPGQNVTFTHTLKNTGRDRSDQITSGVYWGKSGQRTSGRPTPNGDAERAYNADGGSDSWSNTFRIPDDARSGWRYCQYIRWTPTKWNVSGRSDSEPACVEVEVTNPPECTPPDPRCPVARRNVVLRANVSGGGDTETQGTANFTGSINVSNYPTDTDGGWGYNHLATEVNATRTTAQLNRNGTTSTQSRTVYSCPSGYSPASPSSYSSTSCSRRVTTSSCPSGSYSNGSGGCSRLETRAPRADGTCPAGWSQWGSICFRTVSVSPETSSTTEYSYPNSSTEYRYYCAQTSSWTGWTTGGTTCNDYYVCPGGTSAGAGWARSPSSITCNSWECRYQAAPFDSRIYVQTRAPQCEWRCAGLSGLYPGVVGARPYRASGTANTTGTGELRCFMQPVFDLTCYWDTGTTTTARVSGNGNFCATSTTKPAEDIGSVVCATLQSRAPSGWLPGSPQPGVIYRAGSGTRVHTIWDWQRIAGSGCTNVVGMPYLKVYGGDVRVGGGVGGTTGVCEANNSAGIQTRNQGSPGYAGSGTQFAAISNGFINQFVSGQYNNMATNPNPGTNPTKLSFANNAGGSGYGGGFASSGPCYDYVGSLPSDAQEIAGNTVVNGRTLGAGTKTVQHIRGNAYITNDIVYTGSWTTSASIPLFQLVVEGNIYIDDSVSQLDGVYAAIATNSSTGNIYTCAFVSGASATVPSQTFLGGSNNCKSQLVVNGALAAKRIHFLRDCGSLWWGAQRNPERTTYTGGSDEQTCGTGNHAAEIINYTPETWIRSSAGSGGTKYDSINSLPPIL